MKQTSSDEVIEIALVHEKRPVTFQWLARQLNVTANNAKNSLKDYYNRHSHPENNTDKNGDIIAGIRAVFCLSGTNSDQSRVLMLVEEGKLDEAKESMHSVRGCHIYSLQMGSLKIVSILSSINADVYKDNIDYTSHSMITNTNLINATAEFAQYRAGVAAAASNRGSGISKSTSLPIQLNNSENATTTSNDMKPTRAMTLLASTVTEPQKIGKAIIAPKSAHDFFNQPKRNRAAKTESKPTAPTKQDISTETKDTPIDPQDYTVASVPIPKVTASDKKKSANASTNKKKTTRQANVVEKDADLPRKPQGQRKIRKIVLGEDDDEDDLQESQRRNMVAVGDVSKIFDDDDDDDDNASTIAVVNGNDEEVSQPKETDVLPVLNKVRKKRKVKKGTTYVDARGRLVTEDIWESEYYSEVEPAPTTNRNKVRIKDNTPSTIAPSSAVEEEVSSGKRTADTTKKTTPANKRGAKKDNREQKKMSSFFSKS